MRWCPACQLEYPLEKKFCKACGKPLEEKTVTVRSSATSPSKCPACLREISQAAKFCKYCGASIQTGTEKGPIREQAFAGQHGVAIAAAVKRQREEPAAAAAKTIPAPKQDLSQGATTPHAAAAPAPLRQTQSVSLAESPKRLARGRRQFVMALVAAAVVVTVGLGWYFRANVPFLKHIFVPEPQLGWATIAQPDTPAFEKATRNSKVVSLLAAGQKVELLLIPEQAGAEGILWTRVRFLSKESGHVDVRRLTGLVGETDAAQYKIIQLQLHPADSEANVLREDIPLLQGYIRRFPSSALVPRVKLTLGDRCLTIARGLASQSNPGGPDYQQGLEWGQLAAKAYGEVTQAGDAGGRQAASRGQQEAQQLVALCDAKLNPPPTARFVTNQQSVYRGQPVTLSWSTENANRVILEPGIGEVEAQGSRLVYPSESITYRLVAQGSRERAEATVQVTVAIPQPTVSLTVYPQTVHRGQPVTLVWSSQNANSLYLSPNLGNVGASGRMQVYPTQSTTYEVFARGDGGEAQAQAGVTVVELPQITSLTIPAGTMVAVRLIDTLDSGKNHQGDVFRATLDQPVSVEGRAVIPKFAEVLGRVVEVSASGRVSGVAQMSVVLFQVRAGNATYALYTDPITFKAKSEKGKDAAKIGIGAAIGAAIGAIAGGGKGAAAGAGAGGAAGTGVVLATKGKEIRLESEALIQFRLGQPLLVRMPQ